MTERPRDACSNADFRRKGSSPTNHCWCRKTRVIALSCGIKIFAVHCLVLSQSTRVTDRPMDGRTDGQNYDSQDRASIVAWRGKYVQLNKQIVFNRFNASFYKLLLFERFNAIQV